MCKLLLLYYYILLLYIIIYYYYSASAMWHVTQLDIEKTLVGVCKRLIFDFSIDENARERRKKALLIYGEEYMGQGATVDQGLKELLSRFNTDPTDVHNNSTESKSTNTETSSVDSSTNVKNSDNEGVDKKEEDVKQTELYSVNLD